MYHRWEYTDMPHAFYRLMFTMNPDGTQQTGLYGTNSYWPNAMFYSRPIPGSESKFVTIVGGHHDQPRMGELVLFDAAKGQREADGVIQRIPGHGKTGGAGHPRRADRATSARASSTPSRCRRNTSSFPASRRKTPRGASTWSMSSTTSCSSASNPAAP